MADTSGVATVGAVTFNRPAIDQATGGALSTKAIDPAAQNAITALRLGWAMEELIARSRLEPTRGYQQLPGPEFPPDLTHQLGPQEQLKLLWKLLQVEEKTLLTALPPVPESPGAPIVMPSVTLKLDSMVATHLTTTRPSPEFDKSVGDMDKAIGQWNEQLIALLLDPLSGNATSPTNAAVLSSYEVGKALSRTRWFIWINTLDQGAAPLPGQSAVTPPGQSPVTPPGDSPVASPVPTSAPPHPINAWNEMFKGNRIGNIRRHLDGLANTVDAKAFTTVSTNLEYWHNALHSLDVILKPPEPEQHPAPFKGRRPKARAHPRGAVGAWPRSLSARSQEDIRVKPEEAPRLLLALEEQMDNWYDLLTGRRRPEDFPITGIITDLLNELGTEAQAALPGVVRRILEPLIVPGAIVVLVVIALVIVLGLLTQSGNASPLAGGLAGLSAGLAALVALVMGRGTAGAGQASADLSALQQRVNQLEAEARQQVAGATQALPLPARDIAQQAEQNLSLFSWPKLLQNVLSDVEQQIKIEELNLAISEPLVRYVLAPQSAELTADPKAAAKRFLELIYSGTSNVERLENVFSNLYRQTFTSGQAQP